MCSEWSELSLRRLPPLVLLLLLIRRSGQAESKPEGGWNKDLALVFSEKLLTLLSSFTSDSKLQSVKSHMSYLSGFIIVPLHVLLNLLSLQS